MNSDKACVDALTLPITSEDLQRYGRIPHALRLDLEQRNYIGKFARQFFFINKIFNSIASKKKFLNYSRSNY